MRKYSISRFTILSALTLTSAAAQPQKGRTNVAQTLPQRIIP